MTIAQLRDRISTLDNSELQSEYDCYNSMQARGVQDEIRLTLLEDELYNRLVLN